MTSAVMSPNATHKNTRNAVCLIDDQHAAFVIADDPVSFYGFSSFLLTSLKCTDALYLDGAVSSFYALPNKP